MLHHSLLDGVLLLTLLPVPVRDVQESWVGKKIMFKRNPVAIYREPVKNDEKPLAYLTYISYTVEADQQGWVRVKHMSQIGWLDKHIAVPLEQAVPYFSAQIQANPKDARAYANRAWALKEQGRIDDALKDYNQTVELQPTQSTWYNNRGVILQELKQYEKALADFDEALRIHPGYAVAYRNRAKLHVERKEYDQALADLDQAVQHQPREARTHNDRGWARFKRELYAEALEDLNEAIRLDPDYSLPHQNRAKLWAQKKEYVKAQADFEMAVRLERDSAVPLNAYAWFLATCREAKCRDGKKAIALARHACELSKWKTGSYIDTLAAAYAESGDFAQALRYEKQALAIAAYAEAEGAAARARLKLYEVGKPFREP
jgi:tetratricopeptide (TPR) repeat protein